MKTVCIVGMAPTTAHLFVHEPMGVEVWGLNQGHALFTSEAMTRFTRWFQVHPYEEMAARQRPELGHLEWLKGANIPVYMEEVHPDIPASVRYPYEEVCQTIGGNYMTSEPAFMLALAIHEKFDLIKVYGIDLDCEREWSYERACFEYLLGFAMGRGLKLWLPKGCPLLKGPLYAKTVDVPSGVMVERLRQLQERESELVGELNKNLGQREMLEELIELAYSGKDRLGNARVGNIVSPDGEVRDPLGLLGGGRVKTVQK